MKKTWNGKPYYSFDFYNKERFGEKVYKIALDGGFTCPNRDGTLDFRGCIFCSAGGSGDFARELSPNMDMEKAIEEGLLLFKEKQVGNRFIAYFQAYTNTYGKPEKLYAIFHAALSHEKICGISIATRPDCLPSPVLDVLKQLKKEFPQKTIWIELGLQTIHEQTALYIRRGYSLPVFEQALSDLKALHIPVIVHVILGLPGETKEHILETISYLNKCHIFGIKLQLLHILKHTDLALDYEKGYVQALTKDQYLELLRECIEHLDPEIVVHRITGDGPRDLLVAPIFSLNKRDVLNSFHKLCREQNSYQGKQFHRLPS